MEGIQRSRPFLSSDVMREMNCQAWNGGKEFAELVELKSFEGEILEPELIS